MTDLGVGVNAGAAGQLDVAGGFDGNVTLEAAATTDAAVANLHIAPLGVAISAADETDAVGITRIGKDEDFVEHAVGPDAAVSAIEIPDVVESVGDVRTDRDVTAEVAVGVDAACGHGAAVADLRVVPDSVTAYGASAAVEQQVIAGTNHDIPVVGASGVVAAVADLGVGALRIVARTKKDDTAVARCRRDAAAVAEGGVGVVPAVAKLRVAADRRGVARGVGEGVEGEVAMGEHRDVAAM